MTLLACSLVLLGVAMLASASLRSIQDDVSLTYSTIDRLLAQQAAEAALQDAAVTLSMIPKSLTILQAQGSHYLGEITGERFAQGGPMQSCSAPEYFLEILPQASSIDPIQTEVSSPHRYRVTAKGKGLSEATVVVLRAEFEMQPCAIEKISMAKDVQHSAQKEEQTSDQLDTECIPRVRRLAWRVSHAS
jgi:Tfp pilus assembly protein PilX